MRRYVFKGRLTLDSVDFYLDAIDEAEALARVALGDFDSYNMDGAASVDWDLRANTIEEDV